MRYFLLILALAAIPTTADAALKIVTTTTDYADIARQIGGDKVDVHSVMKGPENVHNVMAKPTEMVFLNKADLFVHSGLDAEPWRDNLLKGARNPKVMMGRPGYVDMSEGIELKEVPTGKIDRSMGDVHAYGNPHYTSNSANGQRMAVTLVKAMAAADPANADFYKQNAKKFVLDMAELQKKLKADFAPYAGLKVVTFHKAWEYFADPFDLNIVTTIEPKPLITPSPAEMRKTIEIMRQQNVKVVIVETYSSYDQAKSVADAVGAKLITLPDHVNGLPEADSYQHLFSYNIHKLIETARSAGIEPKPAGSADVR
ncbi:MAG TPA: metal ABC transporter substrate-binding protein [Tepidisphaeraceae bacterium]|jgi:zinc/manganese transport system substrate-binding protein|nr:metal ABC transporter substrate-binding protein [Tepidisphaeraceae bacterium]